MTNDKLGNRTIARMCNQEQRYDFVMATKGIRHFRVSILG